MAIEEEAVDVATLSRGPAGWVIGARCPRCAAFCEAAFVATTKTVRCACGHVFRVNVIAAVS